MSDVTFVPVGSFEIVPDDVQAFADLVADPNRMRRSPAFLVVRNEDGSDDPIYYMLEPEDLQRLMQNAERAGLSVADLTRQQLFDLLNHTRSGTVAEGEEPTHGVTVVLDAAGAITGVWTGIGRLMAPPPDEATAAEPPAPSPAPPPTGTRSPSPPQAPPPPVARNGGGDSADGDDRRGDSETAEQFFRRTPHMDLSEAEPLGLGQSVVVTVFLDREEARAGETSTGVVVELPPDLEILDLDVMLVGSEHFAIEGGCLGKLSTHRDDARSTDVEFDVTVKADAPLATPAFLTAYLTYQHRPCGSVHRSVELAGAVVPTEVAAPPVAVAEIAVDAQAFPAEVTVDVVQSAERDGRHYLVTLRTTLLDDFEMTEPEPWNFPASTDAVVLGMMGTFTKSGAPASSRQAALMGAGVALWEAAPTCFRDLFWKLIDAGKAPRTIFVVSEEPSIPWELMRPRRDLPNGDLDQRNPLGVDYVVGRWVHDGHRSPKQQESIEDAYVVAPVYRVKELKTSPEETAWVCDKFSGTAVTPASSVNLNAMLAERPVGLLHFIAHGKSDPAAPQTLLMDDEVMFNALEVRGLPGLEAALRKKGPLVFLNACEVGRTTPSLVGLGGFANEFVKAGARAVIAPLWSVRDSIAHEVAVAFYQAALDEPTRPFADILRDIRKKAYEGADGEDSYAAYCFYGDPLTALDASAV